MRYKACERSLLASPDYSSVFCESDNLSEVIAECEIWGEDLSFTVVDTVTGEKRQWFEWED